MGHNYNLPRVWANYLSRHVGKTLGPSDDNTSGKPLQDSVEFLAGTNLLPTFACLRFYLMNAIVATALEALAQRTVGSHKQSLPNKHAHYVVVVGHFILLPALQQLRQCRPQILNSPSLVMGVPDLRRLVLGGTIRRTLFESC